MKNRILLADADELLLAAYRAYLVGEGFEVIAVTNALACLDALREFSPAAMILDPEIPWGSGAGVLAMMREEADAPSVPVILLTSNPLTLTESILPFADYAVLLKPVCASVVLTMLRGLLHSAQSHLLVC